MRAFHRFYHCPRNFPLAPNDNICAETRQMLQLGIRTGSSDNLDLGIHRSGLLHNLARLECHARGHDVTDCRFRTKACSTLCYLTIWINVDVP
jgi:hypothetical protein